MMSPKILVVVVLVVVVVVGVAIFVKYQGGTEKAPVQASAPPAPPAAHQTLSDSDKAFFRGKVENSPTKAF